MSLPYYQMYPKDFDADERVRLMTDAQLGLYLRLLNYSWINNGLPVEPEKIKLTMPGVSWSGFEENWSVIEPCFPRSRDNRRRNKRQEIEREKADRTSKVNRTNALSGSDRLAKTQDGRSRLAPRHARASEPDIRYQISEPDTTQQSAVIQKLPDPVDGLANFLCNAHPRKGTSVAAAGQALAREVSNPNFSQDRIYKSHEVWCEYWQRERTPQKFIPMLANWISPPNGLAKWLEDPPPRQKTAIELAMEMMEEA